MIGSLSGREVISIEKSEVTVLYVKRHRLGKTVNFGPGRF